ncbi:MAG TPA: acyclic terpene utilization AtuA family protein [Actinomycetota bacterium]|nr:acyclic terpene utilization AtuA family protein [Actinomycetota bacterium]
MSDPIRIANCSGFYGDRMSAAREMVEGGPIDVLSGDWLAELTMLILAGHKARDASRGYARSFIRQMEQVMGTCLDRGIKVVSNAGGLNPASCAAAVQEVADKLGLKPRIAYIEGDDLMPYLDDLREKGQAFTNLDTGEELGDRQVLTANAYVGGWGIADALGRGADIVITGRVTDAAVVVGPAAWHHEWKRDDWDALAGSVVAGHIIECGAQATGGNYSFFQEVPGLEHPGFPIAEVASDGSTVITKHEGHGGLVSVGTVTAQLLYEIGGPEYLNPDVTARFDTIRLEQIGPDRVRVSDVRGQPPPPTTKVCMNFAGGLRMTFSLKLTGLDIEEKAALAERTIWASVPGGREAFEEVFVQLIRSDHDDPATNEEAVAELRFVLKDHDETKFGRAISQKIVEMALASYPGFFGGGFGQAQPYGVYWPALIPSELVWQEVVMDGERTRVDSTLPPADFRRFIPFVVPIEPWRPGTKPETVPAPLGRIVGARSGDKGGNANLGVWARTDEAYGWLDNFLDVDRLRVLMPETKDLEVERHPLPNIRAINFVIVGLLGEGVASSVRLDPQAKALGEYLRAKLVDIPVSLLDD